MPFDFSKGELAFDATIAGARVHGLLDTGVDPSVIDLATAEMLHLQVNKQAGGEASGEGESKSSVAYPSKITGIKIGGRQTASINAVASDMREMSDAYGRPLNFVFGYSFLKHQPVLVDYTSNTLSFLTRGDDAAKVVGRCGVRFQQPLNLLKGLNWPVIPAFRLGGAAAPVSLDTGSNSGLALYQAALTFGNVHGHLKGVGTVSHGGFRGDAKISTYELDTPVGFGPFQLPSGQAVTVRKDAGSLDTRVANVGNRVFAAMKLKMLLDYPANRIVFWGSCS